VGLLKKSRISDKILYIEHIHKSIKNHLRHGGLI
jgi:hypothetical protein